MHKLLVGIVGAFGGTFSYTYLLHAPRQTAIPASLIAVAGYVVYLLVDAAGCSAIFSYFLATVVISSLCEISARVMRLPSTTFLLSALVPLVPGYTIYSAMLALVENQWHGGRLRGAQGRAARGGHRRGGRGDAGAFPRVLPAHAGDAHAALTRAAPAAASWEEKQRLDGRADRPGEIDGQLEGRVVLRLFQPHDGFPAHAHKLGDRVMGQVSTCVRRRLTENKARCYNHSKGEQITMRLCRQGKMKYGAL